MSIVIDWLEESKKFDQVSDIYDLYRPSYPSDMIQQLIKEANLAIHSFILEVGAGSGKATKLFVEQGYKVKCIEQGPNLVKQGIENFNDTNLVSYECVPFQDWEIEPEQYDMIFSAQAFHWIPKPQGYKKVAKALKSNGSMMLFWNKYINNKDEVSVLLSQILKEYKVLSMLDEQELKMFKVRTSDGIITTDLFQDVDIFEYPWIKDYSFNDFINFLSTCNGYISLNSQDKQVLNLRLMELFSEHDDKIKMHFNCILFSAKKL